MNWAGAKYGFVIPRSGESFAGGAETLARQLAERLAAAGEKIDILTTCAKDNRSWENVFAPGETIENLVRVLRFPVSPRNLDAWIPLQIRLNEGLKLSVEEELTWIEESVNSLDLYSYISEFGPKYRALIFAPYLFGTTFWGSLIHPQNSILLPCLHDESYAYTRVFASMFRQVKGCIFNAIAEKWFAEDLFGALAGDEVGLGFDIPSPDSEVSASAGLPPALQGVDYLLYLGRKETGKNVHVLVDYFVESKVQQKLPADLKLAILGGGSFDDVGRDGAKLRSDIIDLPFLSEEEKLAVIKNSVCVVQPSTNESFSIVIMEGWLQKVPAVVHARCPVTKYHVEESGGGLYFGNAAEFAEVIRVLLTDSQARMEMGDNGYRYVTERYRWDAVIERFHKTVDQIIEN